MTTYDLEQLLKTCNNWDISVTTEHIEDDYDPINDIRYKGFYVIVTAKCKNIKAQNTFDATQEVGTDNVELTDDVDVIGDSPNKIFIDNKETNFYTSDLRYSLPSVLTDPKEAYDNL